MSKFSEHIDSTVRDYMSVVSEVSSDVNVQAHVEAMVGAALMSGMMLMANWADDLMLAGALWDEVIDEIVKCGENNGYEVKK